MIKARVLLYGHDDCPGTKRARQYFSSRGVIVEERDIFDPKVHEEWLQLGVWATPVIIIDGIRKVGFDERACDALLRRPPRGA